MPILKSASRRGMPRKATYIKSLGTSEIFRLLAPPAVPEHPSSSASVGMGIASCKSKADKLLRPLSNANVMGFSKETFRCLLCWQRPTRQQLPEYACQTRVCTKAAENSPRRACMEGKLPAHMCPKSELCVSELKGTLSLFCGSFSFCTNKIT